MLRFTAFCLCIDMPWGTNWEWKIYAESLLPKLISLVIILT
ncbi:hypothetical protein J2T17_005914 [Paenibacillus mucilaginosus]